MQRSIFKRRVIRKKVCNTSTKYALDGFGNMYDLLKPTAVKKWTVLRKTVSPTTFMFL